MKKWLFAIPLLAVFAFAGTIDLTVTFSRGDLSLTEQDGFTVVALNDAVSTMEPGAPSLPVKNLNVLIPPTAEITDVEIVESTPVVIGESYRVYPAQPARPLTPDPRPLTPAFVLPDPAVYSRDSDFPGKLTETVASGSKSGYRIAGVMVYPVQYNPVTGRLVLYTRLTLRVSYRENAFAAKTLTPAQADLFGADVAALVVNSEKVKSFAPQTRAVDGEVDYAIITPATLVSAWQPLIDLRRTQGLNCVVMPTESIYAHYTGLDNQAKIRAFITDYWQNKGLKWVILGGDHGLVPTRYGYLPYSTYNIPADMYYADLDWSWDSNHNSQYGEMSGDTLDLFGDLYVGRIPCDNATHVGAFIGKDTTYELHPDTTYLKKAFLPWEWLWQNIGHGGFLTNNNIKAILTSDWQVSVVGNATPTMTIDSINSGKHFMHFAGHGNYDVFGSAFSTSNVPSLNNAASRKLTIINSMACFCGEFDDQECLGEALMNSAAGGAVAAMLNARYGWGAPPNMGPGEHFSQEFYRRYQLCREVGVASGQVKDYYRNVALTQMTYRWTMYVLTSYMDPAMPMWTDKPGVLTVTAPDSVLGAPQTVRVEVFASDGPVQDAIVSWLHGTTVTATGRTNSQGWVELLIYPEGGDSLRLCVSARDYLPQTKTVFAGPGCTAASLVWNHTRVADMSNNRLDPGETTDVFVTLGNPGTAPATSAAGTIRTPSPWVTLLDSVSDYGTIAPADSSEGDRYRVAIAPDCPPGTRAEFWIRATAVEGNWQPFFELTIGEAPLQGAYWASHDTGNFVLSVTGLGSVGSTGWRSEGVGMVYPKLYPWSASRLMLGSLVLGTDTSYVCDRFYHPNYPSNDSDFAMTDSVRPVLPPERADEEFATRFSDAPHRNSKNLEIGLRSMVVARPYLNNSCVLEYQITNNGAQASDPLAAGLFCDFKMTGWSTNDSTDIAAAESAYQMAYVYTGDTASLAVKLLYPATALTGISVIDGYNYIQRSGMMSDAVKDSFLWGKKVVMTGATAKNWAAMVSAGPFVIPAGWQQRVAFAIVGGASRANLRANADSIQQWYLNSSGISGDREPIAGSREPFAFTVSPLLFSRSVTIRFSPTAYRLSPIATPLRIDAFDAAGRLIEPVFDGAVQAPGTVTWTPRTLGKGIYFLRVNGQTAKVIRVD
jgi:hypothetical protein